MLPPLPPCLRLCRPCPDLPSFTLLRLSAFLLPPPISISCFFRASFLPYLLLPTYPPTYLPTYLPTYVPSYLPTYLLTYLPTYLPPSLLTDLPTDSPTYLARYLLTYLPTYRPTWLLDCVAVCLATYLRNVRTYLRTLFYCRMEEAGTYVCTGTRQSPRYVTLPTDLRTCLLTYLPTDI